MKIGWGLPIWEWPKIVIFHHWNSHLKFLISCHSLKIHPNPLAFVQLMYVGTLYNPCEFDPDRSRIPDLRTEKPLKLPPFSIVTCDVTDTVRGLKLLVWIPRTFLYKKGLQVLGSTTNGFRVICGFMRGLSSSLLLCKIYDLAKYVTRRVC